MQLARAGLDTAPAFVRTKQVTYPSLFDPSGLLLWGSDELLTYHYLVAEVYRVVPASKLPYADFWRMTKAQQADHIWKHLFIERTPVSEACRGVLTTLKVGKSSLIVDAKDNEKLSLSARNLDKHQYLPPEGVNVYDLLRHPRLNHRPEVTSGVLAEESTELLQAFFQDHRP